MILVSEKIRNFARNFFKWKDSNNQLGQNVTCNTKHFMTLLRPNIKQQDINKTL